MSPLRAAGAGWRLLLTRFGAVRVPLGRRQCRGCGGHYRPAERLIAPLAGANVTAGLARWCADAGASWPYAAAAGKVRAWRGAGPPVQRGGGARRRCAD